MIEVTDYFFSSYGWSVRKDRRTDPEESCLDPPADYCSAKAGGVFILIWFGILKKDMVYAFHI